MVDFTKIELFLKEEIPFFEAQSMVDTKDIISDLIYSNDRGIYLLSGETGVGKSRLIKSIVDEVDEDVFLITEPPKLERDFLEDTYLQLRKKQFSKNVKIDEMRIRVNDAFKKINHTIIIDNIGEIQTSLIKEIGKHLEDIKDLKIILVFDRVFENSEDIKTLFSFEVKENFEIKPISQEDLKEFLSKSLINLNIEKEIRAILSNFDFVYKITDGNFLKFNNLLSTVFDILSTAEKENLDKFKNLNECVLIMSALENELVDGEK